MTIMLEIRLLAIRHASRIHQNPRRHAKDAERSKVLERRGCILRSRGVTRVLARGTFGTLDFSGG